MKKMQKEKGLTTTKVPCSIERLHYNISRSKMQVWRLMWLEKECLI